MRVDTVNGQPMEDIITWRWEADGSVAELEVYDPADGEEYACTLEREPGQDWGVEFTDVLFDGIRTCVNACQFCFMAMLPKDARASLMLRDDDYRLSFLQGNFVTLTNVSDADVERIIRCRMEPMNVSIHAVTPEVRVPLIGKKAMRGMEVLERLCEAGIEIHGQIVLCAGINDGLELERTLAWVEGHPQVTSLAIVPLGYTKYSKRFSSSFSEDREASRAVVRMLEPYQRRARAELGITRFQLSDEFYLDAELPIPKASTYDGYPQFYDGIGMLRYYLDKVAEVARERADGLRETSFAMQDKDARALLVCGEAARAVFGEFCKLFCSRVEPFAIRNDYYGGDVNVTGLVVAKDLLSQLPRDLARTIVVLPEVMFNFNKLTLDGVSQQAVMEEIEQRGGCAVVAVPNPPEQLVAIWQALH
jgi:putative radical SAM enzyme (TIGR03279 family)